jgi:hypothetical protein
MAGGGVPASHRVECCRCWDGTGRITFAKKASTANRGIEVTEMFWPLELKAEPHRASLDRPEVYSFFEASQNSGVLEPEENWNNL